MAVRRRDLRAGVLLFLLALALRLLFVGATPDAEWPYAVYYKGDAPVWLAFAEAIRTAEPFELGLPLRPPGAGYLIAALWNGNATTVGWLRVLWCLLGAGVAPLIYLAALRSFGFRTALLTGLLTAGSTGLLVLSSSLNNETPYLLLVAATLAGFESLRRRPRPGPLLAFGALQAAACLLRVEHALFVVLLLAGLAWSWRRIEGVRWRQILAGTGWALGAFAVFLLPWHLHAWAAIERFNTAAPTVDPATEQAFAQVERAVSFLDWEPGAAAARQALPGCCRRQAADFVAATVAVRGRASVRAEDFRILEEAFGAPPRPLGAHPFVALYGPLNFYLANHAGAPGGFSRAPLEAPPPLAGGPQRYPAFLVQGLPPPQLTFTYPPHLEIVRSGYRLGWSWIRENPGAFLQLAAKKLRTFWQGAALGLSGWNLPLGLSGVRRPVDLVVPEGLAATVWRLAVLALAAVGLFSRSGPALYPWVAFLAGKVVVTVAFFGYARQGATVIPVVALLVVLALSRPLSGKGEEERSPAARRRRPRGVLVAAAVLLALEAARWAIGPEVTIDGRSIRGGDPFPVDEYVERQVEVRWR